MVFRTSLAGACVLIAMLAMMILADTAYGGWIEDLTGLSISGIVNNFFTALGLGDGVAAIMQSASDTWLSQLASYKFDVDASRVADVIAVINKAAAPVGESLIMVFLFQGVFKKVTATDGSFIHGEGLYELVMMLVKFFLYKTLIDLAPLLIYGYSSPATAYRTPSPSTPRAGRPACPSTRRRCPRPSTPLSGRPPATPPATPA